ncbi:SCO family protein [soil metagenome]
MPVWSKIICSPIIYLTVFYLFAASCNNNQREKNLPILGNRVLSGENSSEKDTIYHTIADFKFLDQDSSTITHKDYQGKVYVADFFFTSCPTICPVMKSQMLRVYEKFKDNEEVMILSHTIDPEHDTIPLLKSYAERLGISGPKWRFVTGNKDEIYDIGQGSYMVATAEDKLEPGGFIHSGAFILVDKDRRVRGIYDGTKEDQVDKLINDIPVLLQEYNNK